MVSAAFGAGLAKSLIAEREIDVKESAEQRALKTAQSTANNLQRDDLLAQMNQAQKFRDQVLGLLPDGEAKTRAINLVDSFLSKAGASVAGFGGLDTSSIIRSVPAGAGPQAQVIQKGREAEATARGTGLGSTDPDVVAGKARLQEATTAATVRATPDPVNYRNLETGEIITINENNEQERQNAINRGFVRSATVTQVQGSPGEVFGSAQPKEVRALRDAELGTRSFIETWLETKSLVREGGAAALSAPGAVARGLNNLRANAEGFAQQFGIITNRFENGDTIETAPVRAETIFKRLGVSGRLNRRIKSNIVELAFSAAAAFGQTGKAVSDRDFDRFVTQLAGDAGDPNTFIDVGDAVTRRINSRFINQQKILNRDLKLNRPIIDPLEESTAPKFDFKTPEEVKKAVQDKVITFEQGRQILIDKFMGK